ncbi:MAG: AMP-binding protein [Endozoicomonas sp.]
MPLLTQIIGHPPEQTAIIDGEGSHSYGNLVNQARHLANTLKQGTFKPVAPLGDEHSGASQRECIAFLADRQASSAMALIAIWLSESIAVPLDPTMSQPEWQWRIRNLDIKQLIYPPSLSAKVHYLAQSTNIKLVCTRDLSETPVALKLPSTEDNALILFSSKTLHPFPVVHSFRSLMAQVQAVLQLWQWQPEDRLLHVMPLAHSHGLISGLLSAMAAGSCCEMVYHFKVQPIWKHLSTGKASLFTAVPTLYQYLVDVWHKAPDHQRRHWQKGAQKLRQCITGATPIPPGLQEQWQQITRKPLLFRYGTTEAGLILHGTSNTRQYPGIAGEPFPGVSLRVVDDIGRVLARGPGELEVRSPQLFKEYYGSPDVTQESYDHGWFRTGNLVTRSGNIYQLLGQRNPETIEAGGYRVSAREVEVVLDNHPRVSECAVLGAPCELWGEAICACIVPKTASLNLGEVREWLTPSLAAYKLPVRLALLDQLPKTPEGAIDRQRLKQELCARHYTIETKALSQT